MSGQLDGKDPSTFLQEVKCHLLRGAHFLLCPIGRLFCVLLLLLLLLFFFFHSDNTIERERVWGPHSLLESISTPRRRLYIIYIYSTDVIIIIQIGFYPFHNCERIHHLIISRKKERFEIEIKDALVMLCIQRESERILKGFLKTCQTISTDTT